MDQSNEETAASLARLEQALESHAEQDARNLDRIDDSFRFLTTRMDQQFDSLKENLTTIVERTVAVETMIKVAKEEGGKAGRSSGSKWAVLIATFVGTLVSVMANSLVSSSGLIAQVLSFVIGR